VSDPLGTVAIGSLPDEEVGSMAIWIVTTIAAVAVGGCAWLVVANGRRELEARLDATRAELRRLADSAASRDTGAAEMRREIQAFRGSLELMHARELERRAREDQAWASLQRVTSVLAGSQRTGRVGENVLHEALVDLPPTMVVTDFRVNGRVVEFGLVLPDGRRLPVDSKWTCDRELQELADAAGPAERDRLTRIIENEVVRRAREVAGYLDPAVTAPLAVAAVPDAAYAVLRRAHAEAFRSGVVVIPYSQALPFVLFLYGVMTRLGGAADAHARLVDVAAILDAIEATLENKLARAAAMLSNGSEELRGQLGKARASIASAGPTADAADPSLPGVAIDEGLELFAEASPPSENPTADRGYAPA
jgi:hypothetical protein